MLGYIPLIQTERLYQSQSTEKKSDQPTLKLLPNQAERELFSKMRESHSLSDFQQFQRLSGAHAFSFYAVPIFRATFAGMNPHAAAVVVGFVQLLAAVASGLLIDKVPSSEIFPIVHNYEICGH